MQMQTILSCDEVEPLNSSPRQHLNMFDFIRLCLAGLLQNEVVYSESQRDWKRSAVLAVANLEFSSSVEKKRKNWKRSQFEQQQIYQGKIEGSYCSCQNETRPSLKSLRCFLETTPAVLVVCIERRWVAILLPFFHQLPFRFFLNV